MLCHIPYISSCQNVYTFFIEANMTSVLPYYQLQYSKFTILNKICVLLEDSKADPSLQ